MTATLNFLLVAAVLFAVVKAYNRFRRHQEAAGRVPTDVELLAEIRDELRRRPTV